jgi:TrmH family RNA methyltransferase
MKATKRQLALLSSLRTRKGRREGGFLVEGVRLCEELARTRLAVETVLVASDKIDDARIGRLTARLENKGAAVIHAPASQVQRISDTVHSQGILAAVPWREYALADVRFAGRARVLALDRVSDPGNVGAIIRTAAWFKISAVLLGRECADLLNPKTVRATMGGMFHIPVLRDMELAAAVGELKRMDFAISAAALRGSPEWRTWCEPARSLLILGSEAHGVSEELRGLADHTLIIPRTGAGDSLNVAVTAGIFLATAS